MGISMLRRVGTEIVAIRLCLQSGKAVHFRTENDPYCEDHEHCEAHDLFTRES